ncbi:hypothetical protein ES705_34655 [subsurface metagenome]
MANEILVDLNISDLEFIIRLLELFKGSERYQNYEEEEKVDFDNLLKKLKYS